MLGNGCFLAGSLVGNTAAATGITDERRRGAASAATYGDECDLQHAAGVVAAVVSRGFDVKREAINDMDKLIAVGGARSKLSLAVPSGRWYTLVE